MSQGYARFSNDCGSQTLTQRELQAGAIPNQIIPCPRRSANADNQDVVEGLIGIMGALPRAPQPTVRTPQVDTPPTPTVRTPQVTTPTPIVRAPQVDTPPTPTVRTPQVATPPAPTIRAPALRVDVSTPCGQLLTRLQAYKDGMGEAWVAEQLAKGSCNRDGTPK